MTLSGKKRQATLVVGTTPDYIAWIRRTGPGRCLFLTDPAARETAAEPPPGAEEEILCDLDDYELAAARLDDHLAGRGLALDGISCFDCESMDLAAVLAEQYGLPYPSRDAIGLCRSKYLSKNRWRENGLPCPRVEIIRNGDEAERCLMQMGGQMVLKPATGSGSEFVYRCRSAGESRANYELISSAIHERRSNRLLPLAYPDRGRGIRRRGGIQLRFHHRRGAGDACSFNEKNPRANPALWHHPRAMCSAIRRPGRSNGPPSGNCLQDVLPLCRSAGVSVCSIS